MRIPTSLFATAAVLGSLAGLAACTKNSPAPVVNASPALAPTVVQPAPVVAGGEYYVEGEPPPPPAEVIVAPPGPEFVWVGGYWGWNAGARVWVSGRWERPPQPHRVWVAPRWERRGRGYVFVRGFWR